MATERKRLAEKEHLMSDDCAHHWVPTAKDARGNAVFRYNHQMSSELLTHVKCLKCVARTWFTKAQWDAIPAVQPTKEDTPMTSEAQLEQEIQEKGLTAPRMTPDSIDAAIDGVLYHRFPNTNTIVCCICLKNGYTTVGYSACVSDENFDAVIGEKVAYEDARDKIWVLEGYLLKQKIYVDQKLAAGEVME